MNINIMDMPQQINRFVNAAGDEPVFINAPDGHLKAVILSAEEFSSLIEDKSLGVLALQAEKEGYLSNEQSVSFLNRFK